MVVEILATKYGFAPGKSSLDAWVNAYAVPVTSVIDVASKPLASYDALGRREQAWIVELPSMKIVKKYTGTTDGSGDSTITLAKPDLFALLGK